MPRRYLKTSRGAATELAGRRMSMALEEELERPTFSELIRSQDRKLQQLKDQMFGGIGVLHFKLQVEQPIPLSAIFDPSVNSALSISTHFNDHGHIAVTKATRAVEDVEIDFSKAEDFLQLETPIDARRDHNMLKLAYTIPTCTFMSRLLRKYQVNKKRLAFIQRRAPLSKPLQSLNGTAGKGDGKDVSVSCQVCGQRFTKQHLFQRHILTHPDPENKIFLCQICGKRFNRADHLNRHSLLHQVSVYKCQQCGEEFDRASHLDRHRRKNHPPAGQAPTQTPPQTPQGKMTFLTPDISSSSQQQQQPSGSNLHLLAAVATPESLPSVQTMSHVSQDGAMQFISLLDSELPMDGEHVVQYNTEPGEEKREPERPFLCDVCSHRFIRATHLRRHMRIHTGEKPFTCHICGQRYARGDYLRAHIQAHRRDKIHKCKHCGEVFHDLTRFADHCRLVHRDENDEFGNPCPPPECSPPPATPSITLESTLAMESAEEITMVPMAEVSQHSFMSTSSPNPSYVPLSVHASYNMASSAPPPDMIQMTLVNIPEPSPSPDIIITSSHLPPTPHSSHLSHTPHSSHFPPHNSAMPPLQALAGHRDLLHNGQLGLPDNSGGDVTILGAPKPLPPMYATPDPLLQYIIANGNTSNGQSQPLHHQ